MTTLQDNAVDPTFQNELISPARLLLLAPREPRAPIAILSPAKRNALVACFNAGGLHKRDGAWHGPPDGKPVSGMTTADLARDGMLTVTTNHRFGSAQLTERISNIRFPPRRGAAWRNHPASFVSTKI